MFPESLGSWLEMQGAWRGVSGHAAHTKPRLDMLKECIALPG